MIDKIIGTLIGLILASIILVFFVTILYACKEEARQSQEISNIEYSEVAKWIKEYPSLREDIPGNYIPRFRYEYLKTKYEFEKKLNSTE